MKRDKLENSQQLSNRLKKSRKLIEDWIDDYKFRKSHRGAKVEHTLLRATKGLKEAEREKIIRYAEKEKVSSRRMDEEIMPIYRKSTPEIKKAILKSEIEPEVAEEIIEIKEPEVQQKVLEGIQRIKKKKLKATPEKVREIREEIDLLKGWHNLRIKKTPKDFVDMITTNLMRINSLMPSDPRKIDFVVQVLSSDEYRSYGKSLLKTLDNTLKRNILPFYKELKESLE